MDRAGEIAFLDGRHAEAARWFGQEVRAARSVHGVWTAQEARAQLKQGTALSRLGRHDEALDVLTDAEETASRARAFAKDNNDYQAEVESEFFTYHALAQAGDAALLANAMTPRPSATPSRPSSYQDSPSFRSIASHSPAPRSCSTTGRWPTRRRVTLPLRSLPPAARWRSIRRIRSFAVPRD